MDVKVLKEVREVSIGIPIFNLVVMLVLILISKFNLQIMLGMIFGSIIAILNFRLLALTVEKAVTLSAGQAQAYTASRYMIRFIISAAALIVSVKNPNLNIIGTAIGLVSTQAVIFMKTLIISKFKRKEV